MIHDDDDDVITVKKINSCVIKLLKYVIFKTSTKHTQHIKVAITSDELITNMNHNFVITNAETTM